MGKTKFGLGDRMKEFYENRSKTFLMRRTPVVIRIDGRAFHTLTRGLDKPFDEMLMRVMAKTTMSLCREIQGAKLGYTQSDEISILLTDYSKFSTEAWFGYSVQKMCSISASIATLAFNRFWMEEVAKFESTIADEETAKRLEIIKSKIFKAVFDSRVFSLPKEEVCNYFLWRMQDATKNSISMVAQAYFSHKELHGKSGDVKQDMLFKEHGVNWNGIPTTQKRGTAVVRGDSGWVIDEEMPILSGEGRDYVERLL